MRNDKQALNGAHGAARRRFIKQSSALLASGLAIGFQLPEAFARRQRKRRSETASRRVRTERMGACAA
jgi:hypothetical protein